VDEDLPPSAGQAEESEPSQGVVAPERYVPDLLTLHPSPNCRLTLRLPLLLDSQARTLPPTARRALLKPVRRGGVYPVRRPPARDQRRPARARALWHGRGPGDDRPDGARELGHVLWRVRPRLPLSVLCRLPAAQKKQADRARPFLPTASFTRSERPPCPLCPVGVRRPAHLYSFPFHDSPSLHGPTGLFPCLHTMPMLVLPAYPRICCYERSSNIKRRGR
jgi:hypothetical protein